MLGNCTDFRHSRLFIDDPRPGIVSFCPHSKQAQKFIFITILTQD